MKGNEEPREKLPLMDILRMKLAHHQAKAGQISEAIALLSDNPDLERVYELIRTCKG